MVLRQLLIPSCVGVATLIGLNLTAQSGVAQQPNCNNPQNQTDMNICSGLDYQQADKKLNQVYPQLQGKLQRSGKKQLTDAQLAWIKFRDANCEFEKSEVEGGTMAPSMLNSCSSDMTKSRTAELQSYINGQIPQPTSRNYQTVDRRLNQVYQQLVPKLSSARRNKLQSGESAWIAFRDANCNFEGAFRGGNKNACLTRMTEQRTTDLEKYLNNIK